MPDKRALGLGCECYAAAHLASLGYRIRAQNYRARGGELDLIAEEGEFLLFIEVKARSGQARGLAREAVSPRKQRRMLAAAFQYLREVGEEDRPCRYFTVEVVLVNGSPEAVEIIPDVVNPEAAFLPGERPF